MTEIGWHSDIRLEQIEIQASHLRRIQFNIQSTGGQKIGDKEALSSSDVVLRKKEAKK